jgi:Fic family protein
MSGVRGEHATPGQFRRRQNWIGPAGCTLNEASFVPPPVPQMHEALRSLEEYLHGDDVYPPLIRLALFHYQFEAIHPFLDGNGRIGRLLISLLLVEWRLLPLPLLYLSAYFHGHRQEYYDLLDAVSERGAWEEWVRFFLRGVTEQARDAVYRATQLHDIRASWHERLMQVRASALLVRLADALFESPIITIPDVQKRLDVTYPTAQRNVEKLVSEGILQQIGQASYGKTFIATEILEVIGDGEA